MPGNTDPIYSRVGRIAFSSMTNVLGRTTYRTSTNDGTNATTDAIVFTADATNGSFIQRIRFKAFSNTLNNGTAAVARVWINNGSAQTTATNNTLYDEISLPTTTGSTTVATPSIDLQMNFVLPAGHRIIIGVSSSADLVAGWVATVIGGDY